MVNEDAHLQLDALARDLAASSGAPFKQVAHQLVAEAAAQIETLAKAYSPVKSGHNRDAINAQVNGMSAIITASSPYARYLEYGTGTRGEFPGAPIVIHAKPGGVMRFVVNGKVVYAKKVTNPGMAPRPFMRPAAERVADPFINAIGDNAILTIMHGPNAPETLKNAAATTSTSTPKAQSDAASLVKTGAHAAKSVSTAKKAFV